MSANPDAPPFAAAAAALDAGAPRAAQPPTVRALLDAFGLQDSERETAQADARLLRLAARLGPLFRLPAPDAPGLIALGTTIDLGTQPPASASGVGETPAAALRACLGEAAEYLASLGSAADRAAMRPAPPADAAEDAGLAAQLADLPAPSGWLPALRLTDGATLWLPREMLLRLPEEDRAFAPPWPPSLGCAAGATPEQAALHALLELIERDAVALWWQGGLPARAIALEDPTLARSAALLARLRRDRTTRQSWLLDITSDLGVPVAAAISFGADGSGFCCGFAARAEGLGAAAEAAVLELAQMELAHALAAAKEAARGASALNARDAAHRRRFTGIRAAACPLVHPALPPRPAEAPAMLPAEQALGILVGRLAAAGFAPILFQHSGPGSPESTASAELPSVLRILCPGLEREGASPGARMRAALAETGGGLPHRFGITLA